jgi:hypothetical protein
MKFNGQIFITVIWRGTSYVVTMYYLFNYIVFYQNFDGIEYLPLKSIASVFYCIYKL